MRLSEASSLEGTVRYIIYYICVACISIVTAGLGMPHELKAPTCHLLFAQRRRQLYRSWLAWNHCSQQLRSCGCGRSHAGRAGAARR